MDPTIVQDLASAATISQEGTLSRTLYHDEQLKVVLFGFAAGQELSEHTAAVAAVLHIVQGEAQITLGDTAVQAHSNTWIHMPPHLPHSIRAVTPVVMLLLLLKGSPSLVVPQ